MDRYKLHYKNPHNRDLQQIADRLLKGDILVFPTDTIYAMGCLLSNKKGIDRIIKITGKKEKQAKMSLICRDISMASQYAANINNQVFKMMKRVLPGPFTFIVSSNIPVQRQFKNNKKEIGLRIPDQNVLLQLLDFIDEPLISTSMNLEDDIQPYYLDPEVIKEKFNHQVDMLIDGGLGSYEESTVVDCTGNDIFVKRAGKGDIALL